MRRTPALAAALVAALAAAAPAHAADTLLSRAILPADAYQEGPASGAALTPANGVTPPFPGQPIPGFSALLKVTSTVFWAMPDNGFGSKANSADFLLRLYRIRTNPVTPFGGSGKVTVERYIQLSDPENLVPFPIAREDRKLTGADFDLESVRLAPDGTLWFGEEFGPYLLHVDPSTGKVLDAPIQLPGVKAQQNHTLNGATPNLPSSRGFEGMALSKDGTKLYPILEGALTTATDPRERIVNEFDLATKAYTANTWKYRTDAAFPNAVIGDFTALDRFRYLAIERDDFQGVEAKQKKIYLVDLRQVDEDGYLRKTLVLDLLRMRDPFGISSPARPGEFGVGRAFSFPLQSVESLEVMSRGVLAIANDNNYPFSFGRWTARNRPDDTEIITVLVERLLRG